MAAAGDLLVGARVQNTKIRVFRWNETIWDDKYSGCGLFVLRVKNDITETTPSDGRFEANKNSVFMFDLESLLRDNLVLSVRLILEHQKLFVTNTVQSLANYISTYLLGNFQFDSTAPSVCSRKPRIVISVDVFTTKTNDETREKFSVVHHHHQHEYQNELAQAPQMQSNEDDDDDDDEDDDDLKEVEEDEDEDELEDEDYEDEDEADVKESREFEEDEIEENDPMDLDPEQHVNREDLSHRAYEYEDVDILHILLSFAGNSLEFCRREAMVFHDHHKSLKQVEVALKFPEFDHAGPIETCQICLEEFSTKTVIGRTPCSHVFHRDCIFKWLSNSNSCPLCRAVCVNIV